MIISTHKSIKGDSDTQRTSLTTNHLPIRTNKDPQTQKAKQTTAKELKEKQNLLNQNGNLHR